MITLTNRKNRVPLHLPVDVSGLDAKGSPFAEMTRTLNVSAGGICFESRQNLLVGGRLTLYIRLPLRLRKPFGGRSIYGVKAVICRVEPVPGEEILRVGARFLAELEA